jgi:hypothetical protein
MLLTHRPSNKSEVIPNNKTRKKTLLSNALGSFFFAHYVELRPYLVIGATY